MEEEEEEKTKSKNSGGEKAGEEPLRAILQAAKDDLVVQVCQRRKNAK